MTPNLQIEYRAIDALLPYARNPRTHSPAQIAKIAASIVEFGWTQPILVDGDNGIIAGHGRLAAARKLELSNVPVIELGHLTPAQKRAYVIADNRLALDAGWDDELLALELAELSEAGYDLLMTGFNDDELAQMLADIGEAEGSESDEAPASNEDDDVPEPPKQPISRPGDVWQLGPHRLICGDASDASVVATLMQGEQASLCFTSPPYGNQRDYTSSGIADWDGLMRGVFHQLPMAADGQVLVNLGLIHRDNEFIPYWDQWLDWMRSQGWRRFAWVRPAWAHSCGWKSRRKLITTNEVKRNCMRVTECGKEAWSVICEPMNKNRIEGAAEQGERAHDREALVIKAKWRKSGGCAEKECVLTWGDLALCLKGRRGDTEREVSSGHSSCRYGAKGQTRRSVLRHVDV